MTEFSFITFALLIASPFVMYVVGWGWLVIHGFRNDQPLWAVACFFVSPLSFIYGLLNYDDAKLPFWMMAVGTALFFGVVGFVAVLGS